MQFSAEQEEAIERATNWYRTKRDDQTIFRLFGYAGTGKTTVLDELTRRLGLVSSQILFLAPTGRAAVVMRSKGVKASTIHSALYSVAGRDTSALKAIAAEMEEIKRRLDLQGEADLCVVLKRRLRILETESLSPKHRDIDFIFRGVDAVPEGTKLIVVDEASMIRNAEFEDLESLQLPVVLVGDPGQLPPVPGRHHSGASKVFEGVTPDVLLTQVHRQAGNSPILRLAHIARSRQWIRPEKGSDFYEVADGRNLQDIEQIFAKTDIVPEWFDVIITTTNRRRREIMLICTES